MVESQNKIINQNLSHYDDEMKHYSFITRHCRFCLDHVLRFQLKIELEQEETGKQEIKIKYEKHTYSEQESCGQRVIRKVLRNSES